MFLCKQSKDGCFEIFCTDTVDSTCTVPTNGFSSVYIQFYSDSVGEEYFSRIFHQRRVIFHRLRCRGMLVTILVFCVISRSQKDIFSYFLLTENTFRDFWSQENMYSVVSDRATFYYTVSVNGNPFSLGFRQKKKSFCIFQIILYY